jgi:GNAT superfamily N-acetyltransferase
VTIQIRPATPADRDALVELVPRLRAFGAVPLRPVESLDRAEQATLERALAAPDPETVLLVAEGPTGRPAGVAYAHVQTDYFTGERHGHLGIIAVSEVAEGQGMGRALLAAVESWARERGHRYLTLNVFAANVRARAVYERAGYGLDILRYYKELGH